MTTNRQGSNFESCKFILGICEWGGGGVRSPIRLTSHTDGKCARESNPFVPGKNSNMRPSKVNSKTISPSNPEWDPPSPPPVPPGYKQIINLYMHNLTSICTCYGVTMQDNFLCKIIIIIQVNENMWVIWDTFVSKI